MGQKLKFREMGMRKWLNHSSLRKQPKFYFQPKSIQSLKKKMVGLKEYAYEQLIADRALKNTFLVGEDKDVEGNFGDLHAFDIFYAGGFTKEYFERVSNIPFKYFLIPGLLMLYSYAVSKYSNLKNIRSFSVTDAELQGFLEKYFKDCPLARVS